MRDSMRHIAIGAVVFATVAAPLVASAQGLPEWGVKGGLSAATMRGGLEGLETLYSFGAGAYVSFPLHGGLGLQPEVLYVTKGASYGKSEGTDPAGNSIGTFETLIALEYVEIPVLLRWTVPTSGMVHPRVLVGPAFAFKISSKLKVTGALSASGDIDEIKNTDVGIAFGGSVGIGRGRRRVTLEGRYTVGLPDVAKRTLADPSQNSDLLILAGVSF